MDGVRHPVGPEPAATYWWRRGLVVVLLALVVLVVALVAHGAGGPRTVAAAPAAAGTSGSVPSKGSTTSEPSAAASSRSAGPAPSTSSAKPSARSTAKPTGTALPACNPAQMEVALTGSKTLAPGRSTVFRLSMVNDGPGRCQATVRARHFELKVYSGTDRIWSSKDCAGSLERVSEPLGRGKAAEWRMTWNGRRSAPDCQDRPGLPGAGTYVATAQLDGSRPARLRMTMPG